MVVLIFATRRDNGLDFIQLSYSKVNSPLTETKVKHFWGWILTKNEVREQSTGKLRGHFGKGR